MAPVCRQQTVAPGALALRSSFFAIRADPSAGLETR